MLPASSSRWSLAGLTALEGGSSFSGGRRAGVGAPLLIRPGIGGSTASRSPAPGPLTTTGRSAVRSDVEITMASASIAVISLAGDQVLAGYEPLRTGFARAAIRGINVIVDLSDCDFIDSTAISMLLHTETIVAPDGGRLVVALPAAENTVTRGAEVIKLAELLPTYASFDAALASFQPAEAAHAQPV